LREGQTGFCRARENRGGAIRLKTYGQITSLALDPVEKKPLYHYFPGHTVLSAGGMGCNLGCRFCQNWEISQQEAPVTEVSPEQLAHHQVLDEPDCIGLAFTYNEPTVAYEFVRDTFAMVKARSLHTVLVTNGYVNLEPLDELLQVTDALNIDLKAFTEDYYRRMCLGHLEPVKEVIRAAAARRHVELTTLVIPGWNDSVEEMSRLSEFIAGISREIPLHLTRYFPNYKLSLPSTPLNTMKHLWDTARMNLPFVYMGNIGAEADTVCPECGEIVVRRQGFAVRVNLAGSAECPRCGQHLPIITA
jgi:pyruvate formate lyase activating enzyme